MLTREPKLSPRTTQGASAQWEVDGSWMLEIPPGHGSEYRLAQLDDTAECLRRDFVWNPPLALTITARVSSLDIPGTWGFGFWNDPFSFSLGLGVGTRRFPALPNAAWFFYGSPQNSLSFRDDMPSQGFLAQVFRSPKLPPVFLAAGGLGLPFLAWPWIARRLRPVFRHFIRDHALSLDLDVCEWHTYALVWREGCVSFDVDGTSVFKSPFSPRSPLGLVIWIDNQYAAYTAAGKVSYGLLPNPGPSCMQIKTLVLERF